MLDHRLGFGWVEGGEGEALVRVAPIRPSAIHSLHSGQAHSPNNRGKAMRGRTAADGMALSTPAVARSTPFPRTWGKGPRIGALGGGL